MKQALIFLAFIFLFQLSNSQNCKLKEMRDVDPETGEVFSKTSYNYDSNGNLLSWDFSGDYSSNCTITYGYNNEVVNYKEGADGFIHFTHWYKYMNKKISEVEHRNDFDVCKSITRYTYDSEGRMKKISEFDTESIDTILTSEETFYYEKKSSPNPYCKLEFLEYNTDSMKLTYDDKINPYFISMAALGDWEQNNILSQELVDLTGTVNPELSMKFNYTYNKNNLPEKVTVTDGNGNFFFAQEFYYDCK